MQTLEQPIKNKRHIANKVEIKWDIKYTPLFQKKAEKEVIRTKKNVTKTKQTAR